jgi:hypothetical protein
MVILIKKIIAPPIITQTRKIMMEMGWEMRVTYVQTWMEMDMAEKDSISLAAHILNMTVTIIILIFTQGHWKYVMEQMMIAIPL